MQAIPVIVICDGTLEVHDDVSHADASLCFEDAVAEYTTVVDLAGRFYRVESEEYTARFVLDDTRSPDPQFVFDQLRGLIERSGRFGLTGLGSADVATMVAAIRNS